MMLMIKNRVTMIEQQQNRPITFVRVTISRVQHIKMSLCLSAPLPRSEIGIFRAPTDFKDRQWKEGFLISRYGCKHL